MGWCLSPGLGLTPTAIHQWSRLHAWYSWASSSQQPWKHKWENIIPEGGDETCSGTYCELVAEPGRGGMSLVSILAPAHPGESPSALFTGEKLLRWPLPGNSKTPAPPEQSDKEARPSVPLLWEAATGRNDPHLLRERREALE